MITPNGRCTKRSWTKAALILRLQCLRCSDRVEAIANDLLGSKRVLFGRAAYVLTFSPILIGKFCYFFRYYGGIMQDWCCSRHSSLYFCRSSISVFSRLLRHAASSNVNEWCACNRAARCLRSITCDSSDMTTGWVSQSRERRAQSGRRMSSRMTRCDRHSHPPWPWPRRRAVGARSSVAAAGSGGRGRCVRLRSNMAALAEWDRSLVRVGGCLSE